MKIVFMGTPQFAVPTLEKLMEGGHEIVAVITATDKPAGRGKKLSQSAVKKFALEQGLYVMQPPNLKNPDFLTELRSLKAELQVVVAFRMLPEAVFAMPPEGCVNLHASLLPQYRGAAPINRAIMNGESITGTTTFFIEKRMDTGNILFQKALPIGDEETAGELHDRLMTSGAELMLQTVNAIENGSAHAQAQVVEGELKKAPKIFKEDCQIDWNKEAYDIYNHIRGLSPYPAAFTELDGQKLKIFAANIICRTPEDEPGSILTDEKTHLHYVAKDGLIEITELQLQGKKRIKTGDFLRGYRFQSHA